MDTPKGRRPDRFESEHRGKERVRRTSVLRVPLFQIAHPLCKQFYGNVFVVREQVPLCGSPCIIDKRVGISRESRYTGDNVASEETGDISLDRGKQGANSRIQQENLLPTPPIATLFCSGEVE